jgi:GAF domain-containing protein
MRRWSVGARGQPPVQIEANSWLVALGLGLERLDESDGIERLACEVLQNGTVIVRDISNGNSYVVQPFGVEEQSEDFGDDVIEVTGEADRSVLIGEATDIDGACRVALESARQMVTSESGAVLLIDGDSLTFATAFGPKSDDLEDVTIPLGQGIAGYAMQKQRIVIVHSAREDARHFSGVDAAVEGETRALAAFPIIHEGAVLGAIELLNLPEGARFSRAAVHHVHMVTQRLAARIAALRALGH